MQQQFNADATNFTTLVKAYKALQISLRKKERRKGHMKDALALGGEEGRDKLR